MAKYQIKYLPREHRGIRLHSVLLALEHSKCEDVKPETCPNIFTHPSPPCQVVESEEEEELTQAEEEGDDGGQFDVIPLYSERATVSNLGSSGTGGAASFTAGPPKPMLLLLLLLSASLSWG